MGSFGTAVSPEARRPVPVEERGDRHRLDDVVHPELAPAQPEGVRQREVGKAVAVEVTGRESGAALARQMNRARVSPIRATKVDPRATLGFFVPFISECHVHPAVAVKVGQGDPAGVDGPERGAALRVKAVG